MSHAADGRVDSYRFLSRATSTIVRGWIEREPRRDIPWTALGRPLERSTVALVSSAGLAMDDDVPFDREGERRDPWWGDPTFRILPRDADATRVRCHHLHMNPSPVERDPDCAFPLRRLLELERVGAIGRAAPSHYSFMGYVLDTAALIDRSVPRMIRQMKAEEVDVVLLVPF